MPEEVSTAERQHAEESIAAPSISRAYLCQCGRPVFLRNSRCLACSTPLGFVVERLGVMPLAPIESDDAQEEFTVFGEPQGPRLRRCGNFDSAIGCNWMRPASADADEAEGLLPGLCLACSTTRTIPDLSVPENPGRWNLLEQAKRRLMSQLLALGLPVRTRIADPVHGLAFDLLSDQAQQRVMTGHSEGVITLNIAEAEDAVREQVRAQMHEPYRTLLGHFRHEIGHYYWDVLVAPQADWLDGFRAVFGDERADYGAALQTHYANGPRPDWVTHYVSSYAGSHPWEDWAETWAHYLHMADTVDTAISFGVNAARAEIGADDLFHAEDLWQPQHPDAASFLEFLNAWVRLTHVLNEFSRSMGQPDTYPFVLPHAVVPKLQFIHVLIADQRKGPAATQAPSAQVEGG
ncbi:putative zinc-binding metallopeptidase [Variovorax dokdonensis]|uniref:Zinc-binding metallopeptidase n=1 Tax=Variovorax dokdonensis TaxID=344883 RepID=A0ABT7NAB4_9BURK|nr:putative zinc-binding metallopeptidase [Variovorax dokdonensis]MDM0044869.1 putative zinc-binding metallopeptidase [Variovorax dokdonensis]